MYQLHSLMNKTPTRESGKSIFFNNVFFSFEKFQKGYSDLFKNQNVDWLTVKVKMYGLFIEQIKKKQDYPKGAD